MRNENRLPSSTFESTRSWPPSCSTLRDDGQTQTQTGCSGRLRLRRLDRLELAEDVLELSCRDSAASVVHDNLDRDLFGILEALLFVERTA
jgi:hypothetical protein